MPLSVGTRIDVNETMRAGFYRFTFNPPNWLGVPQLSVGAKFSVPLTDYVVELVRFDVSEKTGLVIADVEVYTLRFVNPDSFDAIENVAPATLKNPYEPIVRYPGGYGKESMSIPPKPEPGPTAIPQIAVGAIIAIVGLGVLYLTLDKIETLVESPTVNIALAAVIVIGGFIAYKQFR